MTVRYPRHILGLDPGTVSMGWCLIEVPSSMRFKALGFGTINPRSGDPLHRRLAIMMGGVIDVVERAKKHCAECVVERPFVNKNNMATLAIAAARGIALAAIGAANLRFNEYSPQTWKQITGSGAADALRYSYVVQQLLGLKEQMPWDAAAAGGLAIYHGTKEDREDE